jgi:hypothetical protein
MGAETFRARVADGKLEVGRGDVSGADVVLAAPPMVLAKSVYGGVPLGRLERQGAVEIVGDRDVAERFVTFFPLPAKA